MASSSIVVVGAGIAGLTSALALHRAGHRVRILEKRQDATEAGAGLQISPNASRILIELGLSQSLCQTAVAPARIDIRRLTEARILTSLALHDTDERYGAPFWVMLRQDLHGALLTAARQCMIPIDSGVAVETVELADGGLRLALPDGPLTTKCLVGADGLWSVTRALLGDRSPPRFAGFEAWRGVVAASDAPAFARAPAVNLWLTEGAHVVHYPVAAGRQVNIVIIRRSREAREGWDRGGDAKDIMAFLEQAGAARDMRDLARAVPGWQVWSLFDRARPGRMAGQGVALVGDSAHPMLPFLAQGAAMAIEDAACLAETLPPPSEFTTGKIAAGLDLYHERRCARVARVQAGARRNGQIYHAGGLVAFGRDVVLGYAEQRTLLSRQDWIYSYVGS